MKIHSICWHFFSLLVLSGSIQSQTSEEEKLGYVYLLPVGDTPKIFRDGEVTEDGYHLQSDPPSGEQVPFKMLITGASVPRQVQKLIQHEEGQYKVALSRNRMSHPILINKSEEGFRLVNQPSPGGGGPVRWSIHLPKSAEALAIITPKKYGRRPWASPVVKMIDCSVEKIPAGSILIVNMSPYKVSIKAGKHTATISPGKSDLTRILGKEKIPLTIQAYHGGGRAYLHRQWVELSSKRREVFVIYASPKSGALVKVDLCKTSLPLKPSMQWLKKQTQPAPTKKLSE